MKIQQENIREYTKIRKIREHFFSWTIPRYAAQIKLTLWESTHKVLPSKIINYVIVNVAQNTVGSYWAGCSGP